MQLERLKLAYRKSGTNIWLVRATGGKFLEHFRQSGLVAIGHLDNIYDHRSGESDSIPSYNDIESILLNKAEYTKPVDSTKTTARKLNGKGTRKLRQISCFNEKIKSGDIVVSTDGDAIIIGICAGGAFFGADAVTIGPPSDDGSVNKLPKMTHRLRRKVVWGPRISRYNLPSAIKKTLQGQQTIIDLQKHWDKFYHLIYPFFVDEDFLYVSNKITSPGAVNNLLFGGLLQNISLMQHFAAQIEETGYIDLESIARVLNFEIDLNELSATTKTECMSPGDLWNRIPLAGFADKAQGAILCIALTLVLAGYVRAEDFPVSTYEPVAETVVPSDMVLDIFRSPKKQANKQKKAVGSVEMNARKLDQAGDSRHAKKINESLALRLPMVDTNAIENFEFGIPSVRVFGAQADGQ